MYMKDPAQAVYKYNSYSLIKVTKNNSAVSKTSVHSSNVLFVENRIPKKQLFPTIS